MSPFDPIPLGMTNPMIPMDRTGYGPTGMGNAPTAREARFQAMNKHYSDKYAIAMQFNDPYVEAATRRAMQLTAGRDGKANSPGAIRRAMYGSAGGQAAMDIAMGARRMGVFGQGDPVNYARNVAQGIAGGGFQMTTGGTMAYRDPNTQQLGERDVWGGKQNISGQGPIAERVISSFQKNLVKDLYGEGLPDPSKMYGFDMEETSGMFQRIAAQGGGLGHVAHLERNASGDLRLDAMSRQESDPMVIDALQMARKRLGNTDRRERIMRNASAEDRAIYANGETGQAALDSAEMMEIAADIGDEMNDPKMRKAIERAARSTDALVTDQSVVRKMGKIVEEVAKGAANLADIYGHLSSSELQDKLEVISGTRITNLDQARSANQMVQKLTGAAKQSGVDPYVFMQTVQQMQKDQLGLTMQAGGFDRRTASDAMVVNARMVNDMAADAMMQTQVGQSAVKQGRDLGLDLANAKTFDENFADIQQGQLQGMQRFKGYQMVAGGEEGGAKFLVGETRQQAMELAKKFESTTNAQERDAIEGQIRSLLANVWSQGGETVTFEQGAKGPMAAAQLRAGRENRNAAKTIYDTINAGRAEDQNVGGVSSALAEFGFKGSKKERVETADMLMLDLGTEGMVQAMDIAKDTSENLTGKQRQEQIRRVMKKARISDEDASKLYDQFFTEEGRLKDEEQFGQLTEIVQANERQSGQSVYARQEKARRQLMGTDGAAQRIRKEGGSLSLNSIITTLATGKADLEDPETMMLAMEAMGKAGAEITQYDSETGRVVRDEKGNAKKLSTADNIASGLNLSDGFTDKELESLDRVYGKDLELYKKVINPKTKEAFGSRKEMLEAAKDDEDIQLEMLNQLRNDKEYADKFQLHGSSDSFIAATNDYTYSMQQGTGEAKERMRRAAAFKLMDPAASDKEIMEVAGGKKIDFSRYDITGGKSEWGDGETQIDLGQGRMADKKWHRFESAGRQEKMGNAIGMLERLKDASPEELKQFASVADEGLLKNLQEAQDHMMRVREKEGTTQIYKDEEGKTQGKDLTDAYLADNAAALEKLAMAMEGQLEQIKSQTVEAMTVTEMVVERERPRE